MESNKELKGSHTTLKRECAELNTAQDLYQSNIKGNDCNFDAVQNCSQSYSNVNLGNDVRVYQTSDAEGADETEDDGDKLHYCHSSDLNYWTEPTFSELVYSLEVAELQRPIGPIYNLMQQGPLPPITDNSALRYTIQNHMHRYYAYERRNPVNKTSH